MEFDPALALRMVTNDRLRVAQGWGEFRSLQGALSVTSDAPIASLNCLSGFTTNERNVRGLLDIGFALLRAFDREPAVSVTPLDRPRSLTKHLRDRRLAITARRSWMTFASDVATIATNADVAIRVAEPDAARAFAAIHGGSVRWVRQLSLWTTLSAMLERGNTFYIASLDGQPCGTLHLLVDGRTAGIYAVATQRSHRRRGVSSTLIARAVSDARSAGCDVVCLSTESGGYAEQLYARIGFVRALESELWTEPAR